MDAQALGRYLRQAREAREITLEEAEQTLRIRLRILELFELGDFTIPTLTPVQLRGFLRNYANFLGLEEERVMQYYEAVLTGKPERRTSLIGGAGRRSGRKQGRKQSKTDTGTYPAAAPPVLPVAPRSGGRSTPRPTDTPPGLPAVRLDGRDGAAGGREPALMSVGSREPAARGGGFLGLLTRLLVAGASLAVIAFVLVQLLGIPTQPTDDAVTSGVLGSLPPTLTFTPLPPTFTPRPATQIAVVPDASTFSGEGLQVIVELEQRSWITLSVDGQTVYTAAARPGDRLEYVAANEIALTASNAEALNVTFNGQRQPSLGMRGQRVDITFTIGGLSVQTGPGFDPTPITSPTPLPTPTDPAGALVAQITPPTPIPVAPPALTDTPAAIDAASPTIDPALLVVPTSEFVPVTVTPSGDQATPIPSPTPLPIIPTSENTSPASSEIAPDFAATATFLAAPSADPAQAAAATVPPPPTDLPTVQPSTTPVPTLTPSPTSTPSPTVTASPTRTPTPAGIVPPRQPALSPTPTKTSP